MQRPHLTIVAGCNGAGKSTYSKLLVQDTEPFDYDKRFLEIYHSMRDSELREEIAIYRTTEELNELVSSSFQKLKSFCFETNFHNYPEEWIRQAKSLGYSLDLYFFCLDNIDLAKERVVVRAKNKGHYVEEEIIEFKWKEGYKNVNLYYQSFDYIMFIDNSQEHSPKPIFQLIKENESEFIIEKFVEQLPEYTARRLPNIFNLLDSII